MTGDEKISIGRLADKVDDMAENMVTKELLVAEIGRINTALTAHVTYTRAAAKAETDRIDAILRANAEALKQANSEANESKASAARQTEDVAKTLREVVEATRSANAKSQSEVINPIVNRLTEIEQKQYENKGKEAVSDPAFADMVKKLETMALAISNNLGRSAGLSQGWQILIGAVAAIGAVIAIVSAFR